MYAVVTGHTDGGNTLHPLLLAEPMPHVSGLSNMGSDGKGATTASCLLGASRDVSGRLAQRPPVDQGFARPGRSSYIILRLWRPRDIWS